jgi:hypothetical protein
MVLCRNCICHCEDCVQPPTVPKRGADMAARRGMGPGGIAVVQGRQGGATGRGGVHLFVAASKRHVHVG